MTYRPKILAFAGSLRDGSYNKKLAKIAVEEAKNAGADVTYIDLKDYPMPLYDQDIEDQSGLPENAKKIKKLMLEHDGFLISCPEYNSSMPAVFKNVIDWASRKETKDEVNLVCFIDKVVLLLSASPGQLGGLRSLVHVRSMLNNIYSHVMPRQKSIPQADKAFDENGKLKDPKQQQDIADMTKQFVNFLIKFKS